MTNTTLFNHMIKEYNAYSFTHNYIFGFEYKGNIYMVEATSEILPYILTLDKASRGAGYSLRFKPTIEQRLYLISLGAEVLCSNAYFKEVVASNKYNLGENFEKLVTEYFGQVWEKDRVPFWEDGDITVDGVPYQVKFNKASFTSEKQLLKLRV